ncbi:MAG: hypothetical protein Q8P92_02925 [Candidatus Daviesbacteria bacterium]|nr:hypothetical protein [Candidatus Daviesbacteria bacterium]
MKIPVLIILVLAIVGGFIYFKNTPLEELVPEQVIPSLTGMTESQAVENVKKLPEVQDYLKRVPNGRVEVDNELEGEYNVHVYEIKDGHTATFNWYRVSIKSGEVRAEFEVTQNQTGTVTGKLCYPSEVLPEGKIEAKRLSDGKIFVQNYKGSLTPKPEPYAFELEEGNYYIRYKVTEDLIGYSTTVCPTGIEESCGDKNPRILRKAEVKTNETVSGYDLCDYYYNDSNAPKF